MARRPEVSDRFVDAIQSVPHRLLGGATLQDVLNDLAGSKWYRFTHNLLQQNKGDRSINRIVCLGIGSMENEARSLIQFAFAVLLAEHFRVRKSSVMVYDPAMSRYDEALVENHGFRVGRNELDFHSSVRGGSSGATLMYMPFLPFHVIQEVFSRIVETDSLQNTIFLGRDLEDFVNPPIHGTPKWFQKLVRSHRCIERPCDERFEAPRELYGLSVVTIADSELSYY